MVSRTQAEVYAKTLMLEAKDAEILKKVYLFGSLVAHGSGNDADMILEVSEKAFEEYAGNCVGALDGFHPIKKELLPMCSPYWDYFSPLEARYQHAMKAIGIYPDSLRKLEEVIPRGVIDIVCLPEGWNADSDYGQMLEECFGVEKDPKLYERMKKYCVEIKS